MIHSLSGFQLPSKLSIIKKQTQRVPCFDNRVGNIVCNGKSFISVTGNNLFGLQRFSAPIPSNTIQQRLEIDYKMLPLVTNERIVVLLESPHKTEYLAEGKTHILGPAMGASGDRFNSQCIKVFNNNLPIMKTALGIGVSTVFPKIFDVYFVNAIQYQCSLGETKVKPELRDFIFESLWECKSGSFKEDLIERLNLLKPRLIINACTSELKKICCNQATITTGLNGFIYSFLTASAHVSAWDKNTSLY